MPSTAVTPQHVAEAVRDAMWKDDRASQLLGIECWPSAPARRGCA
jgi:hypothetical protein